MATTNTFYHPVFKDGAFSSTDPAIRAYATQKVMHAMEVGVELGAKVFVFWGGREGYQNLWNTNIPSPVFTKTASGMIAGARPK